MELQLFKLYHNEREIDEWVEEKSKKEDVLQREVEKKDKIEEELRDKKKEHGKLVRELGKIDQSIKECVSGIFLAHISIENVCPTVFGVVRSSVAFHKTDFCLVCSSVS